MAVAGEFCRIAIILVLPDVIGDQFLINVNDFQSCDYESQADFYPEYFQMEKS